MHYRQNWTPGWQGEYKRDVCKEFVNRWNERIRRRMLRLKFHNFYFSPNINAMNVTEMSGADNACGEIINAHNILGEKTEAKRENFTKAWA
jgi:hypothetical protein